MSIFLFYFFQNVLIITKKSRIPETKHLSTDADSSINTTVGQTKNTQKPEFFEKREKSSKPQKTQKRLEICQNQRYALRPEVSNPLGSVVSGWTKNTQKPDFFEKRKKSSKTQKLKNVQRYAKISDTPFDQRSLIHRDVWFLPCFVKQNQPKNKLFLRGDFRQFQTKMFKYETTSFHYFSPRIPNLLKYWTSDFGKWGQKDV